MGGRQIVLVSTAGFSGGKLKQKGFFHSASPGECVPTAFVAGGGHSRWMEKGVGVNIFEDARHSSVLYLYICKYFVLALLRKAC
jgi:hypothetical protein